MHQDAQPRPGSAPRLITLVRDRRANTAVAVVLVALAVLTDWLCERHPAVLPVWAPWEFSWTQFLGFWLILWWYLRGLALTDAAERPAVARQVAFMAGMGLLYAVLQTRFIYLAEHMFFLNRVQHLSMHHLGPMLIALAWPGATIRRGLPAMLQRLVDQAWIYRILHVVQQPLLAAVLFVGLIALWLVPSVHFRAMIDPRLFAVMNWSMVIDGVLFWCLVLDPRPSPPARTSFGVRAAVVALVMFPQIGLGAMIALSPRDLYPYYDLCGRIFPSFGALYDQVTGGVIIWIPAAMMSILGLILVINFMRLAEERRTGAHDEDASRMAARASQWTGL